MRVSVHRREVRNFAAIPTGAAMGAGESACHSCELNSSLFMPSWLSGFDELIADDNVPTVFWGSMLPSCFPSVIFRLHWVAALVLLSPVRTYLVIFLNMAPGPIRTVCPPCRAIMSESIRAPEILCMLHRL
jgi:hypothetical protein